MTAIAASGPTSCSAGFARLKGSGLKASRRTTASASVRCARFSTGLRRRASCSPIASLRPADAVVFAVAHKDYVTGGWPLIAKLLKDGEGIVLDIKAKLDRDKKPKGIDLWRP